MERCRRKYAQHVRDHRRICGHQPLLLTDHVSRHVYAVIEGAAVQCLSLSLGAMHFNSVGSLEQYWKDIKGPLIYACVLQLTWGKLQCRYHAFNDRYNFTYGRQAALPIVRRQRSVDLT